MGAACLLCRELVFLATLLLHPTVGSFSTQLLGTEAVELQHLRAPCAVCCLRLRVPQASQGLTAPPVPYKSWGAQQRTSLSVPLLAVSLTGSGKSLIPPGTKPCGDCCFQGCFFSREFRFG